MCSGYYDYDGGYMPDWPGMERFKGTIVHPQHWPEDLDYAGKRVVVIGSGATAVTLVPAMADKAAHVTMLQRSPTYVVARPAKDAIANWLRRRLPASSAYALTRWKNVLLQHVFLPAGAQAARRREATLIELAQAELGPDYDVGRTSRRATIRGTSGSAWCPTATCSTRSARARPRSSPTRSRPSPRPASSCSPATSCDADIIVTATGLVLKLLGGTQLVRRRRAVDPGADA